MRRTSLTGGPFLTGPARAHLSPEAAPLQPAPKHQVDRPHYRQDAYHREHRDHPEEHSNRARPFIARFRVLLGSYPGLPPPVTPRCCKLRRRAGGSYASHLRPRAGGGARRDGGDHRGTHNERGTRPKRALRGLSGRLLLRGLSARGGGGRENGGGGYGLAVVGVGAIVGARDGRTWFPVRGEVLGSGSGARRLGRGDYGVRGVVAVRRRGVRLPLGSHETAHANFAQTVF